MKKLTSCLVAAFVAAAFTGSAYAATAEEVMTAEKCNKCHTATTTKKGPSFGDIAKKYKGNAGAKDKLFMGLKNGGKFGDEEDHKKVSAPDADIKAVVDHILAK